MVAELIAAFVVLFSGSAELLHSRRKSRLAPLSFGPSRHPALWARCAPFLVVIGYGAICWGLVTLLLLDPRVQQAVVLTDEEKKHVVLVLDVSPSMHLQDAGPEKNQSRMKRASSVLDSFSTQVLIGFIEETYGVSVGPQEQTPANFRTVNDIAAMVARKIR